MAVYFVTGKLGSGKTLSAVYKIRDYLMNGRKVATNLNISLTGMFGYHAKNINLVRIPDKPDLIDLESIGRGNSTYDESLNGLLVLDECGTWFNSRSWADKSRQELINWFAHARKLGWDILFLVQSLHVVDKQSRLMFAEHVVYCRRADRLKIPYIHWLLQLVTLGQFQLPKIHMAIVKYGDSPTALVTDRWFYQGGPLYSAYDTKQQFSDFYAHGAFCVLPPHYYVLKRTKINVSFFMRLTKIYFKRSKRLSLILFGIFLCLSGQFFYHKYWPSTSETPIWPLSDVFIDSYITHGNQTRYQFSTPSGILSEHDLTNAGIKISQVSPCKVSLNLNGVSHEVTCK
ncbi:assembly protein [Providencia rettgeri]|uniref:zonular occludens toxin domain-containing protein n=1 Tax=Providencia rettgeri TaxID=587 RepID=UPI00226E29FF|nr:zonular occludens toxin domain-containing protein [Providencia rettgeri]MCX9107689.1 assembly protein [Providencia rettgeri]HEM6859170.1 assembly protein [Providencia rettgeri]